MGTKYSSNSASGYNATPPDDDGTVSEANKVKWSTAKTKLADPVKDLADTINTDLVAHFDRGPTALTSNTTLGATHFNEFIQVSGSGVTLTLTDAATLTAGWFADIVNTDTANSVSLARATASDTIDATSNDVTIYPLQAVRVFVTAAANGFRRLALVTGTAIPTGAVTSPVPINARISPSVAASALTIALKGNDGNDPSAANAVYIPFRNATAGTGSLTWLPVTAALSTVISSGSTGGHASGQNHFIYVYGLNNSGTVELAWSTALFDDGSIQSTTAEGGAGAADSATTLYSTSARSNVPIRLICRMVSNQTVAGTWAAAPTEVTPWPWSGRELRSIIHLTNGNGHGSTNTHIRRFTTTLLSVGSDVTYADSAADGASFTINTDGIYSMSYSDKYSGGATNFGISKNSAQLTTALISIDNADILMVTGATTNLTQQSSVTVPLIAGTVLRPHTDSLPDDTGSQSRFTITRVE